MSGPDLVNGLYESMGGILLALNCFRLYKDKEVKGISIFTSAFFASWGYWNLFYYPHLHQWLSFLGGILVVSANTVWVIMAIYYQNKKSLPNTKKSDNVIAKSEPVT